MSNMSGHSVGYELTLMGGVMTEDRLKRSCLVIKTGEAIGPVRQAGDFEDWISAGMGVSRERCVVCRVDLGKKLPQPGEFCAAVVTGSSAMVSHCHDWSLATGGWLAEAVEEGLPLLGICYGHQLLAQAFKAPVGADPKGREIGTVTIRCRPEARDDPLFSQLPDCFPAQVTHEESVLAIPEGGVWLASSEHTPIQAFRIGNSAWGVQFHPEFDAEIMRGYIRARAEKLEGEGLKPRSLEEGVREAPASERLLEIFASYAGLQKTR